MLLISTLDLNVFVIAVVSCATWGGKKQFDLWASNCRRFYSALSYTSQLYLLGGLVEMWIRIMMCFDFGSKWCGLKWLVLFHVPSDPPPETSIYRIGRECQKNGVKLPWYPLSCFLCDKVRTYHRTQSFLYFMQDFKTLQEICWMICKNCFFSCDNKCRM